MFKVATKRPAPSRRKKHCFRLRFKGAVNFSFDSKADLHKAIDQIQKGLKLSGLNRADFHLQVMPGKRRGRGLYQSKRV